MLLLMFDTFLVRYGKWCRKGLILIVSIGRNIRPILVFRKSYIRDFEGLIYCCLATYSLYEYMPAFRFWIAMT